MNNRSDNSCLARACETKCETKVRNVMLLFFVSHCLRHREVFDSVRDSETKQTAIAWRFCEARISGRNLRGSARQKNASFADYNQITDIAGQGMRFPCVLDRLRGKKDKTYGFEQKRAKTLLNA